MLFVFHVSHLSFMNFNSRNRNNYVSRNKNNYAFIWIILIKIILEETKTKRELVIHERKR